MYLKKIDPQLYKQCNKCRTWKPRRKPYYHRHSSSPDNLQYNCVTCQRKADIERYQQKGEQLRAAKQERYHANPEEHRQRVRDYHSRNPERHKRAAAEWNQANPERHRVNQRRYRNSEKGLEYERQYAAANRALMNLKETRRRARKRNLPDTFTHQDYERMMTYWGDCCAITGAADNLQLDHWIPLNSPDCPGTVPTNIIPLSASMNASKQDKDPAQWLRKVFASDIADEILTKITSYFQYLRENCPD